MTKRKIGPLQSWRSTALEAQEQVGMAKFWFTDADGQSPDMIDMSDSIRIGMQHANKAHELMQRALREREAELIKACEPKRKSK